jgi:hypothetical protein
MNKDDTPNLLQPKEIDKKMVIEEDEDSLLPEFLNGKNLS